MENSKKVIVLVAATAAKVSMKSLNKQNSTELEATIKEYATAENKGLADLAAITSNAESIAKKRTYLIGLVSELTKDLDIEFYDKKPATEKKVKEEFKGYTPEEIAGFEANVGKVATFQPNSRLNLGITEGIIVKFFIDKRSQRATYQLKTAAIGQPVHTLPTNKSLTIGKKATAEQIALHTPTKAPKADPATNSNENSSCR